MFNWLWPSDREALESAAYESATVGAWIPLTRRDLRAANRLVRRGYLTVRYEPTEKAQSILAPGRRADRVRA